MPYSKYFKNGQKILLCPLEGEDPDRHESLTLYVHDIGAKHFDLKLPYQEKPGEEYPFTPGMKMMLSSESIGLGIKVSGVFESRIAANLIRVRLNSDLKVFQRRLSPRTDASIGLRYAKGRGTMRSFRSQWEKNVQLLSSGSDLSKLSRLPRYAVNLGPGGIRFKVKPPVGIADICLLLMELDDKSPPICALAEVVWFHEQKEEERYPTGMQFISIRKSDQARLEAFVQDLGMTEQSVEP